MKSIRMPHPSTTDRRKKETIQFSVVVPFFNEQKHIERCIKALLDQDFDKDRYEIIFINNGSTDGSSEIVRRYPKIVLLNEEKHGSYAARNKGINTARGNIIAFCDADCEVSVDWLSQIRRGMERTEALIVLGKRHYYPAKSFFLQIAEDYENSKVEYLLERQVDKRHLFGFTNNMAVRAELFNSVGLFREISRGADTEFVQRYLASTNKVELAFLPEMVIRHLEITGIKVWLKKRLIRGENNKRMEKISNYKSLSYKKRISIFRYCLKKNNYTPAKSFTSIFLLLIGVMFYSIGEMKCFGRQQALVNSLAAQEDYPNDQKHSG
jgi:glycosyltransferase involved in cell wall biosynthesis